MISEVQSVVHEFRRITLLWEELWLGTLTQQHSDVQRRLAQLETEICKVQANSSLSHNDKLCLIREKHRVLLLPVGLVLSVCCSISTLHPVCSLVYCMLPPL